MALIFKHWKLFYRSGWLAIAARQNNAIIEKEYQKRFQPTLGEYINWYFTDKSFLHHIKWMGIPTRKMVPDMWVYQEIIFETRPDIIIEIGSWFGGSTLYLAQMQEHTGAGEVISIDVSHDRFMAKHPRIKVLTGDCSDPTIFQQVKELVAGKTVMLIHDGDHTAEAVFRDLKLYAPLVSPGMYLIVEDGIIDIYKPEYAKIGKSFPQGGPLRASENFLREMKDEFELDMRRERFILTTNPRGYLRRKTQD